MGKPCKTGLSGSRSISGILSGAAIRLGPPSPAGSLPPTWSSAGRVSAPIGVAPGGACLAAPVSGDAGGLLHHRFTLASAFTCDAGGRSPLCCAIQRVSPSGSYPAPLPCGVPTFLDACAPRLPDRHEKVYLTLGAHGHEDHAAGDLVAVAAQRELDRERQWPRRRCDKLRTPDARLHEVGRHPLRSGHHLD